MVPSLSWVHERLGPGCSVAEAGHWISGRRGLTYFVTRATGPERSVFKWCRPQDLVCWRDLLPALPIGTPRVIRWWEAASDVPAAVELEFIPHRAVSSPGYRFSPAHLSLSGPSWRLSWLDLLFARLARMHACCWEGGGWCDSANQLTRTGAADDLEAWNRDLQKLEALANLPGAAEWIAFWAAREPDYRRVLDELFAYPLTWYWGDAKWDHIGCRDDGTLVVLEWSTAWGPAGSDLYVSLFEPPTRRTELLRLYLRELRGRIPYCAGLSRCLHLGLMRACYVHGPGQACLSLRGPAGSPSTAGDKAAWAADAAVTAGALQSLEQGLELF